MSQRRRNKSKWIGSRGGNQPWYIANVKRQRRRRDIAYESRRRNRGTR